MEDSPVRREEGIPNTMKAWRFDNVANGAENHMHFETIPLPSHFHYLPENATLIKVHLVGLNPVDIKFAETPIIGRYLHPYPAIPGHEGVGRVVKTRDPTMREGELVMFRMQEKRMEGALAEYIVVPPEGLLAYHSFRLQR